MAPRFHRRRDDADEAPDPDPSGSASLHDHEHAWWAQRDLADVWSPREPPPGPDEPERDVLAEHFGPDWRTTFGFDDVAGSDAENAEDIAATGEAPSPTADASDPEAGAARVGSPPGESGGPMADGDVPRMKPPPSVVPEPLAAAGASDPYAVLQVDPGATWDEIVMAHRSMARRHHPDRLFGQSPNEVAAGEEWIRAINGAFAELRVRRGR